MSDNTETTIQTAATTALAYFHKGTRDNGESYWYADKEPKWVRELIYTAHGEYLPDDWRYRFIVEALEAYAESPDADDVYPEPDVYTSDLLQWLASNLNRTGYVDSFVDEVGESPNPHDIMWDISGGQQQEKLEVYAHVRASLEEYAAERSEDTTDTESEG